MPGKEKYYSSQADQVRRYLNGEMNPSEMHALEKSALDDPFLADAIEGLQSQPHQQLKEDFDDVSNRVSKRTEGRVFRMPVSVIILRAAAAVVILALIGIAGNYMFNSNQVAEKTIAEVKPSEKKADLQQSDTSSIKGLVETIAPEKTTTAPEQNVTTASAEKKVSKPVIIPSTVTDEKVKDSIVVQKESKDIAAAPAEHLLIESREKESQKIPDVKVSRVLNGRVAGVDANKNFGPGGSQNVFFYNGQVKDQNNQPVSFANITIKNSNSTTYADAQGNFRFIAADSLLNIDIRSVGFAAQSAVLTYRDPNPVLLLKPMSSALDEKVVSGKSKKVKPFVEIKSQFKDSLSDDGLPAAEPVDGWGAYHLYLLNNVKTLFDASGKKIDGMVTVSFLISESGWQSEFKIEKSLNTIADKEAIRLIKEGPKWELYNSEKPMRAMVTVIF